MKSLIAERVKDLLNPALHPVVDARVEKGLQTYKMLLDDNVQPEVTKAVHLIEELLDSAQYTLWLSPRRTDWATTLTMLVQEVVTEFPELVLDDLLPDPDRPLEELPGPARYVLGYELRALRDEASAHYDSLDPDDGYGPDLVADLAHTALFWRERAQALQAQLTAGSP